MRRTNGSRLRQSGLRFHSSATTHPPAAAAISGVALFAVVIAAVIDATEQRLPNVLTVGSGLVSLVGHGTVFMTGTAVALVAAALV